MDLTIFARDSKLWVVLFYTGMALNIALPLMSNPAEYGIGPVTYKWMVLINAVITGLAGKMGWSWSELSRNMGGGSK